MNEDKILQEIRKLTLNDEDPIDKVLTKIVSTCVEGLKKYKEAAQKPIEGNILSFLLSKGATYATIIPSTEEKYSITSDRIGYIPYSDLYIYGDIFPGEKTIYTWYLHQKNSNDVSLYLPELADRPLVRSLSVSIQDGYLVLPVQRSECISVYIIPDRSFISFSLDYISIGGGKFTLTDKKLSQEVMEWLYLKKE